MASSNYLELNAVNNYNCYQDQLVLAYVMADYLATNL